MPTREECDVILCYAGVHDGEHALMFIFHIHDGSPLTLEEIAAMRGCKVDSIERRIRSLRRRGWIEWDWGLDPDTGRRVYRFRLKYETIQRDIRAKGSDPKERRPQRDQDQMRIEFEGPSAHTQAEQAPATARRQRGSGAATVRQRCGNGAAAVRQRCGSDPCDSDRLKERARDHGHGHGHMVHAHARGHGVPPPNRKRNAVGGPCIRNIDDPAVLGDIEALRRLWRDECRRGSVGDNARCSQEDFFAAAIRAQQVSREEGGDPRAIFAWLVNQRARDPDKPGSWWRLITTNQRAQAKSMLASPAEEFGRDRVLAVRAALALQRQGRCSHPYILARDQCRGLTRDEFHAISAKC